MAAPKRLAPLKPLGLKPVGQKGQPAPRPLPKEIPLGAAPPGRPPSNLADYLIKPTPNSDTGFEMLNTTPDVMAAVQQKFLSLKQLPPNLRPQGLKDPRWHYTDRPTTMETNRAKQISRGFNKPRSRQG